MAKKLQLHGSFPSKAGENGGFYTPNVSQPDSETLEFTFTKSKEGMPTIPPIAFPLPTGALEESHLVNSVNLFDCDSASNRLGYVVVGNEIRQMDDVCYSVTHPIYLEAGVKYKVRHSNKSGANVRYARVTEDGDFISGANATLEDSYEVLTPTASGWYVFNYNPNLQDTMVCQYDLYPEEFTPFGRTPADDIGLNKKQLFQAKDTALADADAILSPLYGKKLVLTGDSIAYGAGYEGGYGKIIAEKYNMAYQNVARSGATVVTGTTTSTGYPRTWICRTIDQLDVDADYVVLEGGVNDAATLVPMGAMSEGYDAELDESTFYGAFESMLRQTVLKFPGKKICYIMVHKIKDNFRSDSPAGSYYHAAKACCQKWGIAFCDLGDSVPPFKYFLEGSPLYALRQAYTLDADGTHPNQAGYEAYYVPRIAAFLETLPCCGTAAFPEGVTNEQIKNAVDAYMAENPETDPTVPEWAKQPEKPKYTAAEVGALPADAPIPDGGIPIPSSAQVGQTIVVKAVDETGKPTEWEAADLLNERGEIFTPVFHTTLSEDVNSIDITHFSDGIELSLSDARVYMVFAGTSGNTKESTVSLEPWCGKEYLASRNNISIQSASRLTGTLNAFAQLHIKAKSGYMIISSEQDNGVVPLFSTEENEAKITKIRLWSDGLIAAGTTIEVWGIEA